MEEKTVEPPPASRAILPWLDRDSQLYRAPSSGSRMKLFSETPAPRTETAKDRKSLPLSPDARSQRQICRGKKGSRRALSSRSGASPGLSPFRLGLEFHRRAPGPCPAPASTNALPTARKGGGKRELVRRFARTTRVLAQIRVPIPAPRSLSPQKDFGLRRIAPLAPGAPVRGRP